MVLVRPVASPEAAEEATYPISVAIAKIRARVCGLTLGKPRIARETVAVETLAAAATSSILLAMMSSCVRCSRDANNYR